MAEEFIKFYNCPMEICSCRDENGDPTKISRRFREFYEQLSDVKYDDPEKGKKLVEVMNKMGIKRICCRVKYFNFPLIPMIDRSKNRFHDDVQKFVISEDTRELGFGVSAPDFPIL